MESGVKMFPKLVINFIFKPFTVTKKVNNNNYFKHKCELFVFVCPTIMANRVCFDLSFCNLVRIFGLVQMPNSIKVWYFVKYILVF